MREDAGEIGGNGCREQDKAALAGPSAALAQFAASLREAHIPGNVFAQAEDRLLDWTGSVLAGKGVRPVESVARFAALMGPGEGPSEILISRASTSPYFAAMVNAAASQFTEQDDVHNGAVFHPGAVVFPVALAMAQALGRSGREMLTAAVAGYEVGIRVGEFMGRSHYRVFHTTSTVGPLAAAATAGHLLGLDPSQMLHAFGSAGTQAAGLWEFLKDGADSKQIHAGHAVASGLMAAQLALDGFTGARRILEGPQGMATGMSSDADPSRLTDRLGERWALRETSYKFHASCRHTHPAADALLAVTSAHSLRASDIAHVEALVHQGAIDLLGHVVRPATSQQAKFSMGTVLGLLACTGAAGIEEFDHSWQRADVAAFCERVSMSLDSEVDGAYPARWIGKVVVTTVDGRRLHGRVDEPKGDPANTLSREELESKLTRLALSTGAVSAKAGALDVIARVRALAGAQRVGKVFL